MMYVKTKIYILLPGSSSGRPKEFEAGTASARIRKQLLNKTLIKDIKHGEIRIAQGGNSVEKRG